MTTIVTRDWRQQTCSMLLSTALADKVKRSVLSVSVCLVHVFLFWLLNQLAFDLDVCICIGHDHSSPGHLGTVLEVKVIDQGEGQC